jgi:hypothetical protein
MGENDIDDFELLATAANYIKSDFDQSDENWKDSQFQWIRKIPSGSKGRLGKLLVYQWCALKDLPVGRSPDSDADMLVNGHRVEIKLSTLWNSGIYKFQQIRDQNYEYAVCLGISPNEAHCWVISKEILLKNVIGHLGQHTGAEGQDTAWITIRPNNPPAWLSECGGTLSDAYEVLKLLSR